MRTFRPPPMPTPFAPKQFPSRATLPMRLLRRPRQHLSASCLISPPVRHANRFPLAHGSRVAHRHSGRPAADSAPVYEGDRVEVSRGGKSADGRHALESFTFLCKMHESWMESRSGCTMTRSTAVPRLFRMAGGCNL